MVRREDVLCSEEESRAILLVKFEHVRFILNCELYCNRLMEHRYVMKTEEILKSKLSNKRQTVSYKVEVRNQKSYFSGNIVGCRGPKRSEKRNIRLKTKNMVW